VLFSGNKTETVNLSLLVKIEYLFELFEKNDSKLIRDKSLFRLQLNRSRLWVKLGSINVLNFILLRALSFSQETMKNINIKIVIGLSIL